MRKQLRIVIACLSLLLLICGCVERRAKDNQVEGQQFTVEYKQNAESQRGKATAFFGNRIYYFGRDNGAQGIYCMSLDGHDILYNDVVDLTGICVLYDCNTAVLVKC